MIRERNRIIPHSLGIFFAFALILAMVILICFTSSCSNQKKEKSSSPQTKGEKGDDFILLGSRGTILEASLNLMKTSKDYKSSPDGIFNSMKVGDTEVDVEIDLDNSYACSYNDRRRVVCYPLKQIVLPQKGEKKPICFLHYFDEKGMSTFFHVVVELPEEIEKDDETDDLLKFSPYAVWFLSPKDESYGLVRSRILEKSVLIEEEAFKKFNSSRRTVLMGTNSLDENKFLFIFFKMPALPDQLFQIYMRWY